MDDEESRIIPWKRKPPTEPSTAVVFARQYAESRGLRKLDFRKLLAQRSLREMGFESILDLIVYQLHQEEHRHIMELCNLHFRGPGGHEDRPRTLSFMQLDDSSNSSNSSHSSLSSNESTEQPLYIDNDAVVSGTNFLTLDNSLLLTNHPDEMDDTVSAVAPDDTTSNWKTNEKLAIPTSYVVEDEAVIHTDDSKANALLAPKRSRFVLLRSNPSDDEEDDSHTMDWVLTAPSIIKHFERQQQNDENQNRADCK